LSLFFFVYFLFCLSLSTFSAILFTDFFKSFFEVFFLFSSFPLLSLSLSLALLFYFSCCLSLFIFFVTFLFCLSLFHFFF
jgi:hypothetical protein